MLKKIVVISIVAMGALYGAGIDESFIAGDVSGKIRLGYISQNNEASGDSYATALGGQLKYETKPWNDVKLGAAAYVSEKLHFASGNGERLSPDFFDANGDSFVYLGEAYIDYSASDITLRAGRQLIETPFVESDDIRMLPNSFEAAMATYSGIEKTTVVAGYAQRWAGYDSPTGHNDSLNEFKKFGENHDSSGLYLLGMTNESFEGLALQGWLYLIDKYSDIAYADATYTLKMDETSGAEFCAQYALFDENKDSNGNATGIDGHVYGAGVNVNVAMVTLGAAYNRTANDNEKFITNGLGGGPYYTSMEEMTIDGMIDAKAYSGTVMLDLAAVGAEGLCVTAAVGVFKSAPMDAKVREFDIAATYGVSKTISCDASYAKIEDRNYNFNSGNNAGYSRFLARINYNF